MARHGKLVIQNPLLNDIEQMYQLAAKTRGVEKYPRSVFWLFCSTVQNLCYVARLNNDVVAYVLTVRDEDSALTAQLCVGDEMRNRNIETTLLRSTVSSVKRHRLQKLKIVIPESNEYLLNAVKEFCETEKYELVPTYESHFESGDKRVIYEIKGIYRKIILY